MRILLVEDDSHTRNLLKATLTEHNFLVDVATDAETAWELQQQFAYDLLLLDVMLPDLDGISLCQRLRQAKQTVLIMMLTARDHLTDKLQGLNSGADDYLVKPINSEELIARIRTLLRRGGAADPTILSFDRLSLNPVSREVSYDGQLLKIGRKEYLILELFLRNPKQVYSRHEIVDRLWSLDEELPTEATVKSHIRSIRRKLAQLGANEVIETLYGHGYRLNPNLLKPSSSAVLSQPVEEKVNQLTAEVWQRAYIKSLNKVTEIEQAIVALGADQLNERLRQQTIFTAHKLAGSLSIFGFEVAAHLAQQIEDTFRQVLVPLPTVAQLQTWTRKLRLELTGQQSSIPQIQKAATTASVASVKTYCENIRVLILDDDPNSLQQISSILTTHGLHPSTLATSDTLALKIEQFQPDLLMIDLLMPDTNGLKLCQQIRQHPEWAALPILILSSRSDRETIHQVFAAGADDYIPKPIVADELLTRITNRLNRYRSRQNVGAS